MSSKKIGKNTKMDMFGLKKLEARFQDLEFRVGVMSSAPSELLEMAAFHEFGTSRIPQRSFLRAPFLQPEGNDAVNRAAAKAMEILLAGGTVRRAVQTMGGAAVAVVNKWVRTGNNLTPNAPSTIARKGSSRPLIDTGRMLNAVTWEQLKK